MAVEIKLVLKDGEQQRVEHLAEKAKDVNGALNCSILENAVKRAAYAQCITVFNA